MTDHAGFECAPHDEEHLGGYFAKASDSISDSWNSMGHGYTYDLAITNLYLMLYKNEKAAPMEMFYIGSKSADTGSTHESLL